MVIVFKIKQFLLFIFRKMFFIITIMVALLCLPTFMVHEVRAIEFPSIDVNRTFVFYTVDISGWAKLSHCKWFKFNLWIIGVVLKAIPCILLLWFTMALMIRLHKVRFVVFTTKLQKKSPFFLKIKDNKIK